MTPLTYDEFDYVWKALGHIDAVRPIRDPRRSRNLPSDPYHDVLDLLCEAMWAYLIDIADAPDDESAAPPRFMVPVKRDDGTVEPVYLPAYWDEDGNLRQRK